MDLSTANIPPGLTIIPTMAPNSNGSSKDNGIQTSVTTTTTSMSESRYPNRRVLRPRVEARSYAEIESPDINLNGDNKTEKSANGELDSDDDDAPMPEVEFKELSAAEIWERERKLRKIREELRNEETKLVLLKKIKHSQQVMKENKTPSNMSHGAQNLSQSYNNPLAMLSKGSLTVIPTNLADYKSAASMSR
jgi:Coiled-coil and interaction region of P66A and P66B with MBD2